jgi:hypothetical protein
MFKKIGYLVLFFLLNVSLEAQNSPLIFEKIIMSHEVVNDSVVGLVLDKVRSGAYVKWNVILYAIQKIEPHSKKIILIDSLLKTAYWDDVERLKLIEQKQVYLSRFNSGSITTRDADSIYIELTFQNQLLLENDYYSSLLSYAEWNLQMADCYNHKFSGIEKADSFYTKVVSMNLYNIKDSPTYWALSEMRDQAMLGRIYCARGCVYKLRNIDPSGSRESNRSIYRKYMEDLGEKASRLSEKNYPRIKGR